MHADPLPVTVGAIVAGKYRIERTLGVGGIGAVVLAEHTILGKRVALKFLLQSSRSLPSMVLRFEREARIAARLRSDHVAHVLDVEHLSDGTPFIVMEFLEGEDLDALIERGGPLSISTATKYVLQACVALAEAHAAGIVHRDLKPQNLFLASSPTSEPIVKVLDFGISKVQGEGVSKLTGTADVLGTPHFMAPEQFRSTRDVDARADIWSLGAILHFLVSGQLPFNGESMAQLCSAVLFEPPIPLATVRPELSPKFCAIVSTALEKDPSRRFVDVAAFAEALAPFGVDTDRALTSIRRFVDSRAPNRLSDTLLDSSSTGRTGEATGKGSPPSVDTAPALSASLLPSRRPADRRLVAVGVGSVVTGAALFVVGVGLLRHRPASHDGEPPSSSSTVTAMQREQASSQGGVAEDVQSAPARSAPQVPATSEPRAISSSLVDQHATNDAGAPTTGASGKSVPAKVRQKSHAKVRPTERQFSSEDGPDERK